MMNLKNNKGSITLYIILSFMFFLIIVLGIYVGSKNSERTQEQQITRIQENYKEIKMISDDTSGEKNQ